MKAKYKEGQIIIDKLDRTCWILRRVTPDKNGSVCSQCHMFCECEDDGEFLRKRFGHWNCANLVGHHDSSKPETLVIFTKLDKKGGGV